MWWQQPQRWRCRSGMIAYGKTRTATVHIFGVCVCVELKWSDGLSMHVAAVTAFRREHWCTRLSEQRQIRTESITVSTDSLKCTHTTIFAIHATRVTYTQMRKRVRAPITRGPVQMPCRVMLYYVNVLYVYVYYLFSCSLHAFKATSFPTLRNLNWCSLCNSLGFFLPRKTLQITMRKYNIVF